MLQELKVGYLWFCGVAGYCQDGGLIPRPKHLKRKKTNVSARNVFRYLYSIFMFAAFLVIFVFAPLVLLFGSLVFHCPRSFVLRVRIFLHIVYLAFIVIFRVSSSFSCAWSGLQFNVWVFARPSFSSLSRYRLYRCTSVYFVILRYTSLYLVILHIGSLVSLHQL